jgi:hypothetical protein
LRGKRSGIVEGKERKCEKSRNMEIVNRANAARELVGPTKLKR